MRKLIAVLSVFFVVMFFGALVYSLEVVDNQHTMEQKVAFSQGVNAGIWMALSVRAKNYGEPTPTPDADDWGKEWGSFVQKYYDVKPYDGGQK